MNLIALLGAAVGSSEFCQIIFDDPLRAARVLNLTLTQAELKQLQETFAPGRRNELCNLFEQARGMLCRIPPCVAYQVVVPKPQPPDEEQTAA